MQGLSSPWQHRIRDMAHSSKEKLRLIVQHTPPPPTA